MDKPDVIFHLAAIPRIQPSIKEPVLVLNNNIVSTVNVLDYARQKNCNVVFASSSSVGGSTFANPYTMSKQIGEELCLLYNHVYGTKNTVVRFYNVYGDRMLGDTEFGTVLGIWLDRYQRGLSLKITGDGTQRRDFTHVDDIVEGLITMADNPETTSKYSPIQFGTGENYSLNELSLLFPMVTLEYIDRPGGEMDHTLNTEIYPGWKPKGNVVEYIKNKIKGM
jgi:UDP-glucose 4-epimerase